MPEDSMNERRRFVATERATEALNLLGRFDQLRYSDVINMITAGVWDEEKKLAFFKTVRENQRRGVPNPARIPQLEDDLRSAIFHSFHIADRVGGISGIASMVFNLDIHSPPWDIYNPAMLVCNFHEGQFGRISGLPGQGKTNTACTMMEQWAGNGSEERVAISNILPTRDLNLDGKPDYIYVRDSFELFSAIAALPPKVRWLFFLDEGGLIYGKADASTRRAKDLDKLVRVIRKLHGNFVVVEQRPDSVPTIIQEFATVLVNCERPGTLSIDLRGPEVFYHTRVQKFPKTTLPYDTYDVAFFDTKKVDVPALLEALAGKEAKSAMTEFLKDVEAEMIRKDYRKRKPKSDEVREKAESDADS